MCYCRTAIDPCFTKFLHVAMVRVKAPAMRAKSKDELLKQLEDLKTELSTLQVCVHGVYFSYLLFHVFHFKLFSRLNISLLTFALRSSSSMVCRFTEQKDKTFSHARADPGRRNALKYLQLYRFFLQVQKVTGGATNKLSKIKDVRKSIARCHTVLRANQRENLRKFYQKKK